MKYSEFKFIKLQLIFVDCQYYESTTITQRLGRRGEKMAKEPLEHLFNFCLNISSTILILQTALIEVYNFPCSQLIFNRLFSCN